MSALTVADNKGGKRPQYKDYVTFLGNYKNGKKDDQCSVATSDSGMGFSLNNSSNNSSSSVNSDLTDSSKNGFKDYLEYYNNKKYSPVQPAFIKKDNKQQEEVKIVKTEVYIEINNPPNPVTQVSKIISLNNGQNFQNQSSNVSKVSKIFETSNGSNETSVSKATHPANKVNKFNFEQKGVESQGTLKHEKKKTSIGEISKKFEANAPKNPPVAETQKVQLKKAISISEKSKMFEENTIAHNTQAEIKKQAFSEAPKVFHHNEESTTTSTTTANVCVSPKPPINTAKPVIVPKSFTENPTLVRQKSPTPLQTSSCNFAPPPPPPLQIFVNNVPQNGVSSPPRHSPTPSQNVATVPPPPPPPQNSCSIPPPPPPPPVNFSANKMHNSQPKQANPMPKPLTNGVKSGPALQNEKKDAVDGIPVPVIDKNDPRVKRLVYGALREMYGAYHDKANDYIATLPRNRVKKNNGLDSIINSIASQGGLEKLNGRVNPTVENE